MVGDGYTYFGETLNRLVRSRGYNQSSFARECRRRGYEIEGRQIGQRSISDWMRGYAGCPRDFPAIVDQVLGLDDDEWVELGLAYAYGQRLPREDVEDVRAFREFYRRAIAAERTREGG